jgi:uncharacterized protein (DUF1778 family)
MAKTKKLTRSETITIRVDPKTRFAAELAATRRNESLSSFFEAALKEAIRKTQMRPRERYRELAGEDFSEKLEKVFGGYEVTADELADITWDLDEVDRFINLALYFRLALTADQQLMWRLIVERSCFWATEKSKEFGLVWYVQPGNIARSAVRDQWELLNQVVEGKAEFSSLPPIGKGRAFDHSPVVADVTPAKIALNMARETTKD